MDFVNCPLWGLCCPYDYFSLAGYDISAVYASDFNSRISYYLVAFLILKDYTRLLRSLHYIFHFIFHNWCSFFPKNTYFLEQLPVNKKNWTEGIVSIYPLPPSPTYSLPHYCTLHHKGKFVSINESTLSHYYHPKSIVTLGLFLVVYFLWILTNI